MLSSTLLLLSWQPLMSLQYTLVWWVNRPLILWYFNGKKRKKTKNTAVCPCISFLSLSLTPKSVFDRQLAGGLSGRRQHWIHTINNYIHNWKMAFTLNADKFVLRSPHFLFDLERKCVKLAFTNWLIVFVLCSSRRCWAGRRRRIYLYYSCKDCSQLFPQSQIKFALKDATCKATSAAV